MVAAVDSKVAAAADSTVVAVDNLVVAGESQGEHPGP